jgi:hypothetical protein
MGKEGEISFELFLLTVRIFFSHISTMGKEAEISFELFLL